MHEENVSASICGWQEEYVKEIVLKYGSLGQINVVYNYESSAKNLGKEIIISKDNSRRRFSRKDRNGF